MSYVGDGGETSATAVPAATVRSLKFKSGTIARLVAPGSLTAGRYGLFRWDMPARAGGAGAHFHRTFSASFYVLDGTVSLFDGREWTTAEAGDYLYVPEGGIHGFMTMPMLSLAQRARADVSHALSQHLSTSTARTAG